MILARRRLLFGAGALLAAPAIVRVASIMPVSARQTQPFFEGGLNDIAYGYSGDGVSN